MEEMIAIRISQKKDAFRGPFFLPRNLRRLVPEGLRTESGITFTGDKKIKYELPKPVAMYLLNNISEALKRWD